MRAPWTVTLKNRAVPRVPDSLLDPGPDQLQVEPMRVAARKSLGDESFNGDRAVTGNRPAGQRTITQYVIAELDELGSRQGALHHRLEIAFRPAVEHVDADTQPAHLGQRDGVAQGVGEMHVGIQAGGVLDRKCDTGLLGVRHAGGDHRGEPVGGLSPGESVPAAGEQVDHPRSRAGSGVDHRQQRISRALRVAGQPPAGEQMVDRLHGVVVALQQLWKIGIE